MRFDGRQDDEMRPVKITRRFTEMPAGSALIEVGKTKVLCTASITDQTPQWMPMQSRDQGWVTAEYSILPGAGPERKPRENRYPNPRSVEIQRLVGRALRAVVDLSAFGRRSIWLDCDVLQADGGTRASAITGAYVAMVDAFRKLQSQGKLARWPVSSNVAAVSVALVNGVPMLDISYEEDSIAEVDMNVVITGTGEFVEIQATAEKRTFTDEELGALLALARKGIARLIEVQNSALVV